MKQRFVVNIIHRPELSPEYAEKALGKGEGVRDESLDIFRFQQDCAHKYGLKTTIQMTYASLFSDVIVELAKKERDTYGDEIGLSLLGLQGLSLWRAGKRDHISLVACLLVMAVFGVSESYLLDVFYNFPLLLSITLLFRRPTRAEAVRPVEYALEILKLGIQRGKQLLGRTGG